MANTPREEIDMFFSRFPKRKVAKGELLIWADNPPEAVYYINKGRIRQYFIFDNGNKVTVNSFGLGAFFPMSLVINKYPNRYFFEAIEEVVVNYAPPGDVLDFLKSEPDVLLDLLSRVYSGTEGILQKMSYMMVNDVQKRVVFEIITECKRSKNRGTANLVALKESDLAMHVGLSRETVNRQLAKLKKSGLISVTKSGILVHDLSGLEKLL